MRVYMASSYSLSGAFTKELSNRLKDVQAEFFFPECIGIEATTLDEMKYVDNICCRKIYDSDILVAIYPFGLSVSVEVGRFLLLKDLDKVKKRHFIIFDTSDRDSEMLPKIYTEAMIMPHVDKVVNSIDELIVEMNKYIYLLSPLNS